MIDRPMITVIDDCDRDRHKLEPRYDFEKVGDVVQRTYLCDVCSICGHRIGRPFGLQEQLDHGVVTKDEVRAAMAVLADTRLGEEHLPEALAQIVLAQIEAASQGGNAGETGRLPAIRNKRTTGRPNASNRPSSVTGKAQSCRVFQIFIDKS